MGWIGVGLDGTLAEYHGYTTEGAIGPPVTTMLLRVMKWLEDGVEVRIVTARADNPKAVDAIRRWCTTHVGRDLPITNKKDYSMHQLWDDRTVQVIPNTGRRADEAHEEIQLELMDALERVLSVKEQSFDRIHAAEVLERATTMFNFRY